MTSLQILRAINHRLVSTNTDELPRLAGFLCTSISSCSGLLNEASRKDNDSSLQLHKLKTRVSSLLQDRTQEGRFTGILLAKSIVEAGSITGLNELGGWVRSLLSCLNKPDTPEVKQLCLITLTRIYILVADSPSLIRDIVTPTLPAFISTSINLIKPVAIIPGSHHTRVLSPLLPPILRCWFQLIGQFPTTFRPHTTTIRSISLSLVADDSCPQATKALACDTISRLHFCTSKNVMASEWLLFCDEVLEASHEVCDHIFRSLMEDWSSSIPRNSKLTEKERTAGEVSMTSIDAIEMESWTGLSRGCSMLISLVDILRSILVNTHFLPIKFPIAKVIELCGRITAVTLPTSKFALRANPEITRDEREELFANLPRIHAVVLDFLQELMQTFGAVLLPVATVVSSQIWDVFEAEQAYETIREATYCGLEELLRKGLANFSKTETVNLVQLVKACCIDLRLKSGLTEPVYKSNATGSLIETSSTSSKMERQHNSNPPKSALFNAAYSLLPLILKHSPSHLFSSTSRGLLDGTSIMLDHQEAMLASVLNPPKPHGNMNVLKKPALSVIPFLAVSKVQNLATEALLRPRLPPIGYVEFNATANDSEVRESDTMETDEVEDERPDRSLQDEVRSLAGSHPMLDEPMNSLNSLQNSNQPPRHEPVATSPLKRDYSSAIQRSTDEQLNVSRERDDNDEEEEDEEEGKRIRLMSDGSKLPSFRSSNSTSPAIDVRNEHVFADPSKPLSEAGLNTKDSQRPGSGIDANNLGVQQDPPAASLEEFANTGHAADVGEDDEDSDFEMPTIDTTLSSSDEEEEEEE